MLTHERVHVSKPVEPAEVTVFRSTSYYGLYDRTRQDTPPT